MASLQGQLSPSLRGRESNDAIIDGWTTELLSPSGRSSPDALRMAGGVSPLQASKKRGRIRPRQKRRGEEPTLRESRSTPQLRPSQGMSELERTIRARVYEASAPKREGGTHKHRANNTATLREFMNKVHLQKINKHEAQENRVRELLERAAKKREDGERAKGGGGADAPSWGAHKLSEKQKATISEGKNYGKQVSTRKTTTDLRIDSILRGLVKTCEAKIGAMRSSLFLHDMEHHELYFRISKDAGDIRIPSNTGIAGAVCQTGALLNIPDAYADPRFNRAVDKKTGFRTRSILAVPIADSRGRVMAVCQMVNKKNKVEKVITERRVDKFTGRILNVKKTQQVDEIGAFKEEDVAFLQKTAAEIARDLEQALNEQRQMERRASLRAKDKELKQIKAKERAAAHISKDALTATKPHAILARKTSATVKSSLALKLRRASSIALSQKRESEGGAAKPALSIIDVIRMKAAEQRAHKEIEEAHGNEAETSGNAEPASGMPPSGSPRHDEHSPRSGLPSVPRPMSLRLDLPAASQGSSHATASARGSLMRAKSVDTAPASAPQWRPSESGRRGSVAIASISQIAGKHTSLPSLAGHQVDGSSGGEPLLTARGQPLYSARGQPLNSARLSARRGSLSLAALAKAVMAGSPTGSNQVSPEASPHITSSRKSLDLGMARSSRLSPNRVSLNLAALGAQDGSPSSSPHITSSRKSLDVGSSMSSIASMEHGGDGGFEAIPLGSISESRRIRMHAGRKGSMHELAEAMGSSRRKSSMASRKNSTSSLLHLARRSSQANSRRGSMQLYSSLTKSGALTGNPGKAGDSSGETLEQNGSMNSSCSRRGSSMSDFTAQSSQGICHGGLARSSASFDEQNEDYDSDESAGSSIIGDDDLFDDDYDVKPFRFQKSRYACRAVREQLDVVRADKEASREAEEAYDPIDEREEAFRRLAYDLAEKLKRVVQCKGCLLWVVDTSGQKLLLETPEEALRMRLPAEVGQDTYLTPSEEVSEALSTLSVIVQPDPDKCHTNWLLDEPTCREERSVLCVPVLGVNGAAGQRVTAVVELLNKDGASPFTLLDMVAVATVCERMAPGIEAFRDFRMGQLARRRRMVGMLRTH